MEFGLWVLVRGVAVGAVFGAIPLMVGATRNQLRLGLKGLIACLVGAILFGAFLAMPAAAAFVWLILRAGRGAAAQNRRRYTAVHTHPLPGARTPLSLRLRADTPHEGG